MGGAVAQSPCVINQEIVQNQQHQQQKIPGTSGILQQIMHRHRIVLVDVALTANISKE